MPISNYITGSPGLCTDVWNYLVQQHNPLVYTLVQNLYRRNKNGDFFYEGTVRAQIAHFLQVNIPANVANGQDWIVVSEQPYELYKWRADILVRDINPNSGSAGYTIVIEVKSDLNLESAQDDAAKLLQVKESKQVRIDEAYMFFVCPPTAEIDKWKMQIEKSAKGVIAIGISGG